MWFGLSGAPTLTNWLRSEGMGEVSSSGEEPTSGELGQAGCDDVYVAKGRVCLVRVGLGYGSTIWVWLG